MTEERASTSLSTDKSIIKDSTFGASRVPVVVWLFQNCVLRKQRQSLYNIVDSTSNSNPS
jgi:hypothetical protein